MRLAPTSRRTAPLAAGLAVALATACAASPAPLPPPRWVPPPQSFSCTEAVPCENVKRWFEIEREAAEARPACHPAPVAGEQEACARADAAYARVHREQIEYFSGLCAGSVGSAAGAVRPFVGTPESDRIATCGARGGGVPFTCRLWEWTWATARKGGAFVVFLVEPAGATQGTWAINSCSYCESGGACREFPPRH